jgi:hypothetical protein
MNNKIILTFNLLSIVATLLNACAFAPKAIPGTTHISETCEVSTSEWTIEFIPLGAPDHLCHSEACAIVIFAIPVVTAAIAIPIVLIGNSIHMIEEQLSCN